MILNVAQALQYPGEVYSASVEAELDAQTFSGREIVPCANAVVNVQYVFDGKALILDGVLQATLMEKCSRCNGDYQWKLECPIHERFLRQIDDADDDAYLFEGRSIDLTDMVWDNIYLNLPIAGVCSEDCRGLCPMCGCNLNIAQCDCVTESEINFNQFQKLLIHQDKEV